MKENVRFSSIANKINRSFVLSQLSACIATDIGVVVLLCIIFVYGMDVQMAGEFSIYRYRTVYVGDSIREIIYQVGRRGDDVYFRIEMGKWLELLAAAGIVLLVFQLFGLIDEYRSGLKSIRRKLRPLNEMAMKAQELGEIAFDETKYHNLEAAISKLKVEKPGAKIQMHDKDLMGIEIALNGLLDRMRDSYKQQTQFVSDASHELRTPIAVIQGYVNMLDRWGKEDEEILNEAIEAIKHESHHMQKLVEQLLFLARGDSNRQNLDMKRHNLNAIMKEVYEESLMIDEKHHYRFEEFGDAVIFGDCDMLKQSARILIDNAAKYTQEGEEITIRVGTWSDGSVFYCIQDNGIGMSEQDVEHAFDRFYRADAVRNNKTGGTGLGLSIAKWIVEKHQGYYNVVSRPGIGTRFNVIFPQSSVE